MTTGKAVHPGSMTSDETRQVVRVYFDAYCRRDVPAAAALDRFVPFITSCDLISELYGEGEATLVYDLHVSLPPATQRCAEHFRARDGRICEIMTIFDATPWHPIVEAAARIRGPLEVATE